MLVLDHYAWAGMRIASGLCMQAATRW